MIIYIYDYMSVSPSSSFLGGTCAGSQLQTIESQTSGRGPKSFHKFAGAVQARRLVFILLSQVLKVAFLLDNSLFFWPVILWGLQMFVGPSKVHCGGRPPLMDERRGAPENLKDIL
jgi:hypothetical protein